MEVWPPSPSTFVGLLKSPRLYAAMVAAQEHLWHLEPTPDGRLGVDRALDEIGHAPGGKRIIDDAFTIA